MDASAQQQSVLKHAMIRLATIGSKSWGGSSKDRSSLAIGWQRNSDVIALVAVAALVEAVAVAAAGRGRSLMIAMVQVGAC